MAASLRLILQALQQQREAERGAQVNYFDASSRLFKLCRDVAPNRISTVIFRQLLYQHPRFGKRGKPSLGSRRASVEP